MSAKPAPAPLADLQHHALVVARFLATNPLTTPTASAAAAALLAACTTPQTHTPLRKNA